MTATGFSGSCTTQTTGSHESCHAAAAIFEPVVEQFRSLGCEAQATRYGLVTITLPVEVDVSTIMDLLRDGQERAGSWYFDLGVAPPA